MDRARRGYILIAVLAALALCTALLGAYAAASRRAISLARAEVEATQARYAARGAAIQAAKDLSVGLGRGRINAGAGDAASPVGSGAPAVASTTIEGLPAFPAEMANAAGFLGIIARRMDEVRASAQASKNPQPAPADPASPADPSRDDAGPARADAEPIPMPIVSTGRGYMQFGGADVQVTLESENGKLSLNLASRRMLRDLLLLLDYRSDAADAILNAIEDHRLSLLSETSVAKNAAPRRELDRPLAGATLERIEQILDAPGITAEIYESLSPYVTVLTEGAVDPNYAPPQVLMAVGISNVSLLERVLDTREQGQTLTPLKMGELLGPAVYAKVVDHLAYTLPPLFTVRTRATKGESVGRFMMRITVQEGGPPTMLESREGWM